MSIALYLTSIIVIANFLLSIVILLRKVNNLEQFIFSLLLLSISIWSIGILGFFYEYLILYRDIWIKITHIFGIITSFLFLLFVCYYKIVILKNKIIYFILFVPILFFSYYLLFSNQIIGKITGIKYEIGTWYLAYAFYIIINFLIGFVVLILKIIKTNIFEDKKILKILLTASLLASSPVLIFDLILPYFRIYNYTWVGPLFIYIWISLIFLIISKFTFLNIKLISTEYIVFLLWSSIILRLFLLKNIEEVVYTFIVLILLIPTGIMLIKSVFREIEQREKLEQLNRIKSEFLSFASHQVKAPMAVAKGYAELIMEGIENVPQEAKDFAKKIKEAVDNLLILIEEFMDYRRIEEGRMEYNFENVELISLIKEIFNKFSLVAQEKGLEYKFETKIEKAFAKIDKVRFSQVIQNLIDNALKYTKQGFVKVDIWKEDKDLVFCVSDSGIGMSKELQSKLFGEFVRDPSIKKEIRGTGLGLYIAKNIIEAHQGKIWAESEGEGKGSKFYVKLPVLQNSDNQKLEN